MMRVSKHPLVHAIQSSDRTWQQLEHNDSAEELASYIPRMSRFSSVAPLLVALLVLGSNDAPLVNAFSVSSTRPQTRVASPSFSRSALFPLRAEAPGGKENKPFPSLSRLVSRRKQSALRKLPLGVSRLAEKLRRSVALLCTVALLWLGAAGVNTAPSHASSAVSYIQSTASKISRLQSPTLDNIVDNYVKDHMFDDDVYDPVESSYREAVDDNTKGTYPKALSEVTAGVLGTDVVKAEKKDASVTGIGALLFNFVQFVQKTAGLSEQTAVIILAATFVIAGPIAFVMGGMVIGGISKRNLRKVFKARYGDAYT